MWLRSRAGSRLRQALAARLILRRRESTQANLTIQMGLSLQFSGLEYIETTVS
jgi:hypothetical protein